MACARPSPRPLGPLHVALIGALVAFPAMAAPPDGWPDTLSVGSGAVRGLQADPFEDVVVGLQGGTAWLLSLDDWSVHGIGACQGQAKGVTVAPVGERDFEVWVACGGGNLRGFHFDGVSLSPAGGDGLPSQVEVGTELVGAWYSDLDDAVYALEIDNSTVYAHVMNRGTRALNSGDFQAYPISLTWPNFNLAQKSGDGIFVHHSGAQMTALFLGPVPAVNPSVGFGFGFTPVAFAPSPMGSVYGVDGTDALGEYQPVSGQFMVMGVGLPGADAVATSLPESGTGWLLKAGSTVQVWEISEQGAIEGMPDTPARSFSGAGLNARDAIAVDGYALVGGGSGDLHVLTARPWIFPEEVEVSPTTGTEGDEVSVRFRAAEAGDWEVRRGGDRHGGGTVMASGETSGPDEVVEVQLTIGAGWAEGDNPVYILLRDGQTQRTGHARATVQVDNPPQPPSLSVSSLTFSDGALNLSFSGIPDADLDRYEVYVTTTPFEGSDYATGGPDYDGAAELVTPITIRQAPGESVTLRIAPLENYVMHYVAVRAWDEGGKEGPMSVVLSETPRPSFSAGDLAGERGGSPCSTSPRMAGGLALGIGLLGLLRRRIPLAAGAALFGLFAAAPAHAEEDEDYKGDLTPVYGNFEVRYGVMNLEDDSINTVYDRNPHNMLQIEFGPQLFQVFELDLGVGFFQELATQVDEAGGGGADKTMLTMWPFMIGATFRLQILDEQLIVPHVRYGFDYVIYSELRDDGTGGKEALRGAKVGHHYGFGAGLLLDIFAPRRASLLEATTGINDTYLIFEWRRQNIDHRRYPWASPVKDGFDFSGSMFTVGLKLDY